MKTVADNRVLRFVGERVGNIIVPPFTAVGIEGRDGQVVAGVVCNTFTGPDIRLHVAGTGWTKGFLADLGAYLFDRLKVCRVTMIAELQEHVGLAKRLGGQVEATLRNHFGPGRDGVLVGILREEWRF